MTGPGDSKFDSFLIAFVELGEPLKLFGLALQVTVSVRQKSTADAVPMVLVDVIEDSCRRGEVELPCQDKAVWLWFAPCDSSHA